VLTDILTRAISSRFRASSTSWSRAVLVSLFCRCRRRKAARRATSLLVIGTLLTTAAIVLAACAGL
jgi:hypothetical protein